MIYKIGLLGATGRVGKEISRLLLSEEQQGSDKLELGDAVANHNAVEGSGVRALGEPHQNLVHAWIDFSCPGATIRLLSEINTPILIGTTGFNPTQLEHIAQYAKLHPVILTANTSPGMNFFFNILSKLPALDWVSDLYLIEQHHRYKKDSPSGTALKLSELLHKKGVEKETIHSVRAGNVLGTHSIHFYGEDEEFELIHRVTDRRVFARGALRGILYLLKQSSPGFYSLSSME